jgi:uncharacterized membrane protein YqiK
MEQYGVSQKEAYLILQDLDSEAAEATRKEDEEKMILVAAKKAEQAELDRIAAEAKAEAERVARKAAADAILKQGAAKVKAQQFSVLTFILLTGGVILTAAFFLLGGF